MTRDNEIIDQYFDWMYSMIYQDTPYYRDTSYTKLLTYLHGSEFRPTLSGDQNRAVDGIELRWCFVYENHYLDEQDYVLSCLEGPCSMLEMMIALARKMEGIMDDPSYGDRTSRWFRGMIVSLGLGNMYDYRFDRRIVEERIKRFNNRDYLPSGRGGLFTIKNCIEDLRDYDIWYQMCRFIENYV